MIRSFRQPIHGLAALILLTVSAPAARAQVSTGAIRGTVRDSSSAILVGVTVEASSPTRIGAPAVAITNDQGLYRFDNLPVGEYLVTFTLQGFETLRRQGVRVEVGRSIDLMVTLSVGAMEQSVTVTGDAPLSIDNNSSHADTYLAATQIFQPRRAILGVRFNF